MEGVARGKNKSADTRVVGGWRGKELAAACQKYYLASSCSWRALGGRRCVHGKPAPKGGEEFQLGKTNINLHCSEWSW